MRLERAIEDFRDHQRDVEGRAAATYNGYHRDLMGAFFNLAESKDVRAFTPALVNRTLAAMNQAGLGVETRRRALAAMRSFAKWGLRRTPPLWASDPTLMATPLKKPHRQPKPFTDEEVNKLMALPLSRQEHAARALLYYTGMRATPLCQLRLDQIDLTPIGAAHGRIISLGKGNRETTHWIQAELKAAIVEQYDQARAASCRTLLWRQIDRAPLSVDTLEWYCRKWGRDAGIAKVHPHRWRHTFATRIRRQHKDVTVVQRLMGHASVTTTMGYCEITDEEAAAAAMSLSATPVRDELAALRAEVAELKRLLEARVTPVRGCTESLYRSGNVNGIATHA